jgi:hypothetical protein
VQAIGFYRHLGFEPSEPAGPAGVVYLGRALDRAAGAAA